MSLSTLKYLNLVIFVLYPVAWFAPLMRASVLPLFGMSEVSIMTGLQSLWQSDIILGLIVTAFAVFAPVLKSLGLALIQFNLASPRLLPIVNVLGKFAMADMFLIAVYVVIYKGIGYGRIETAWGLYLFTFCALASLWIGIATDTATKTAKTAS